MLVIGLDAATWDVIDPLIARGALPNLARLARQGTRGLLRSTIPPHTFSAWPAIITGQNPGRLGIYSFYEHDPEGYDHGKRVATGRPLIGHTWFDLVGRRGGRVISYGVPMTYPVWPVNGAMVAGWPTPDLTRSYAYPSPLETLVPGLLPADDGSRKRFKDASAENVPWFLELADRYYQASLERLRELFSEAPVALCMVNETWTDFFAHRFWWLHDPAYPGYDAEIASRAGDAIEAIYRRTDEWIGELIALAGPDSLVVVVSDHGSGTGSTRLFSPNAWLRRQGLLLGRAEARRVWLRRGIDAARAVANRLGVAQTLRGRKPGLMLAEMRAQAEQIDWGRTRAYWTEIYLNGGGIHLNLRGRQPLGIVEPGDEYERLRDEIIEGLRALRDPRDGRLVVAEAHRREDVYRGARVDRAPDILFLNHPDYRTDSRLNPIFDHVPTASLRAHSSGDHRMQGVVLLHGAGVFQEGSRIEGAQVEDVAPTVLRALGLAPTAEMDGQVLQAAFESRFLEAESEPLNAPGRAEPVGASQYTDDEEEGIRAALQGLGYID